MEVETRVLMVSGGGGSDLALRKFLNLAGIQVRLVGSCSEATQILTNSNPPTVLVSESSLPEGTWADILALAAEGEREILVIVVPGVVNLDFYVDALERGASELKVPSFYQRDISNMLESAAEEGIAIQEPAAA